ncbi:MAG TPA: dipeptidase PepV [Firmicutes bacterium]|nr:dipeptidase PepV [Bacillota bacterium]
MIKQIHDFIDSRKDEMIRLLQELIRIPSYQQPAEPGYPFGRGPAQALAAALAAAERMGFTVRNFENYAGTVDLGSGEPLLGILSHLDVVPEGSGWSVDPYVGIVTDGKVIGRGAIDDKGPSVAALYAMLAVRELGIPLQGNVRLILGTNEENGSKDIEYYESVQKMPPLLFTPDGDYPVIHIEKGMLRTRFSASYTEEPKEKRILWIRGGKTINAVPAEAEAAVQGIDAEEAKRWIAEDTSGVTFTTAEENGILTIHAAGSGAHASTPEQGKNALTALIQLLCRFSLPSGDGLNKLRALLEIFPYGETDGRGASLANWDEKSGALTLVFSVFSYADGKMEGWTDIRFPLCCSLEQVQQKLRQALESAGFCIEEMMGDEPHHVEEDSHFVQSLLKVYTEETGLPGFCKAIGGGTYVHHTPGGVAFGAVFPGEDNHMHGADEFITIEHLLLNAKIFAHAIAEICGPKTAK